MSTSHYLIISGAGPYSGFLPRAALDMALTAAAFEQRVSIVFIGDGVRQLLKNQDTSAQEMKNIGKMIPALEMYEVNQVCLHKPSALAANIHDEVLIDNIEKIDDSALKQMISGADHVMVF